MNLTSIKKKKKGKQQQLIQQKHLHGPVSCRLSQHLYVPVPAAAALRFQSSPTGSESLPGLVVSSPGAH